MRIEVRDLVVRYGAAAALDGVTFDVEPGAVFALLGRNGSGKSTLVRTLLGQRRADGGSVRIGCLDPWRARRKLMSRVAATPETPDAPHDVSVAALARWSSRLYAEWDSDAFAARLVRFEIDRRRRFGELSRGQRALVMLALALAPRPELLVLDDPTLGLDPLARRILFGELIGELAERGVTVMLTSHDLDGVERVATHVGILRRGQMVLHGPLEALREQAAGDALEEIFTRATDGGGS